MMSGVFSSIKRFINRFWHQNQVDENEITYGIGNKRANDENSNEDVLIKRRKLLTNSDAGTICIDLTESSSEIIFPHIMPRARRGKNERNDPKAKDSTDVIEVNDDDNVELFNNIANVNSNDVEIVEDDSPARNLRSSVVSSPTVNIETVQVKGGHSSGYLGTRGSSNMPSYLTLSSVQIPNLRNYRNNAFSRPLKELNNKPSISSGYASETYKKGVLTSPNSSSRIKRPFKDTLMIDKLKKSRDRDVYLSLVKQYAYSPETAPRKLSLRSPALSSKQSSGSVGSRRSSSTFDSSNAKHPDLSSGSEKLNLSLGLSSNRRYVTRFQNTNQNARNTLVPVRRPMGSPSSMKLEKSAVDKSVIDLTSEEDDDVQRQEIVSNIISSDLIRNLKTSFVGKDKKIAGEDYIHNILKKYEASIKSKDTEAQKIKQQIRERKDDLNKTLAEILEKRLILKEHEVEVEQKPAYELAPITKAMTAAIGQIVASKKVPLAQIKDTSVKLQDIKTLENCAWLNDEVINAYMNLIKMRAEAKQDKYPKVHCFNTFLYEQLQKKGYNSVRRWTKKIDVFDFNMLIVPIHLGNHWCLIQIKLKEKCIRYFDSMGSPNNHCLKSMMDYLVNEFKDKKNGDLHPKEWELINMPPSEIPQQRNMHDCGVFACTFAEHLTRQAPLNFSQDNMPYFRVKMMYEILTGELLL